ncbi:MAG: PAS domain S-box protein [Euryarchaeota archaeon]|nr:PAS domain S-box protein [Euryarchaeota archaeon]
MDKSISLRELVDVGVVQAIQDSFARTVGVSSVIFLPDGDALTRFSNPIKFCTLIQSTKEGRRRCFQSFAKMSVKAVELSEPEIMYCFAYGAHFVAPIIIDGERKATMYAGQFRPETFSPEQLKELEQIAVEIDLDPELLVKEAKNMHTVGDAVAMDCLHSFFRTVKVIAELGAQAVELRQTKDALQEAYDGLESRVRERTAELARVNEELRQEVAERKAAEDALRESEAKYRLFTETSKDAILSFDMDGRITYVNRAAMELGGYSEEEALQMNIIDILPEDQLSGFYERYSMRTAGGVGIFLYETDFINKAGARLSVEVNSVGIMGDGEPTGLFLACRDITERKAAEDALRESEAKYRLFTETSKDAILSFDMDGCITYLNRAAIELGGYSEEEALQMNIIDILPEDQLSGFYERYSMRTAGGVGIFLYETDFINKAGARLSVEVNSVGIMGDGEPTGLFLVCRDITERKAAKKELRESEEKYRTLIENVQDGVFLLRDGGLTFVNEAFARISGYTVEEVLGMGFGELVAPEDRGMVADRYARMMAGESMPEEYEFHGIRKNEDARTTVHVTVRLIEYQGKPAVIGTVKDITGKKQA